MRHVRMLMLCVGTMLALCAVSALGAATPAFAEETCKKGQTKYYLGCETAKEHGEFAAFEYCPFHQTEYPEVDACIWGRSTAKEQWIGKKAKEEWETSYGRTPPELPSEFTAGKVTVLLKNDINLRGGDYENGATGAEYWIGSEGAPTIEPVAQAGPPLPKDVDTSNLSASELSRYDFYVKDVKETKTTATVELAGPASALILNEENLLTEQGVAFGFPVKVHLSNGFLGSNCYVGSNEHPIVTEFSTGESGALRGKLGQGTTDRQGVILTFNTDTLVSNTFAVPGVEGCGVGGGADEAVDAALGLPSPAGANFAVINGTLRQAGAELVKEVESAES